MTLPNGVFWCWVGKRSWYDRVWLGTGEPSAVKNGSDLDGIEWCNRLGETICSMTADHFLHIFGCVPAPGEALKLDALHTAAHCPNCHVELDMRGDDGCEFAKCPVCMGHYDACVLHARILDTKTLEEK